MRTLTAAFLTVAMAAGAAELPVWDLAKDQIAPALRSGQLERTNEGVVLKGGAAFAVPASAFPDQRNFTVQITASVSELIDNTVFTAMRKQSDRDDGFSFSMNYRNEPWWARQVATVVNNIHMSSNAIGGQRGPRADTPYTFTVSVHDGFASFYIDDRPYKKCYMEVIPNNEPMWIGRGANPKQKPMAAVIHSVKVYGPAFAYTSGKEPKTDFPRGAVAGRGWALDIPKVEHPDWPKVLIYGDSISMGYRGSLIPAMLKQHVYVFHCCSFVNGNVPKQALEEMAGRFEFDAVVFNNGLHSLHWTPENVSDQLVHDRMRDLARCFSKGAPKAKLFYLMTTPHTAPRPAPKKPVSELGDKNSVVIRLNMISAQAMQEEHIDLIDVYSILAQRLELASGDGYHWQGAAYKIISDEIAERLLPSLGKE